jgi:hypothetical protein
MLGECSTGMSVFCLFDWSTMSFETFGMHGASAERICTYLNRCKDLHLHGFAKCMCLKKAGVFISRLCTDVTILMLLATKENACNSFKGFI